MNRIYELGRAIGEKDFKGYMQSDWRETKWDFTNIAEATSKGAKWIARNAGSLLVKASYPITGNLSLPVRERIERTLGEDIFNSERAGKVSLVTNAITYASGLATLAHHYLAPDMSEKILLGIMIGGFMGVGEFLARHADNLGSGSDGFISSSRASLLGKLVSLPIEVGMGIYDGIKSRKLSNAN